MRALLKPRHWLCLPTAFAMVLDRSLDDLFLRLGHDGGEIIWPTLPEPLCRRGFHVQELINVCLSLGYAATRIELMPCATPDEFEHVREVLPEDIAWARFTAAVRNSCGVMEGQGFRCGHAVAYDHGHIFDPDGGEYAYSREACEQRHFFTRHLWRIDRIEG